MALRTLWSQDETTHAKLIQALGMTKGVAIQDRVSAGKRGWPGGSPRAQMFPVLLGLAWASANGSLAYGISTLVFRELATLDGPHVLAGALLIVLGAVVVATAKS